MRSLNRIRQFSRISRISIPYCRSYSLSPLSPIEPERPKTDNPFSDPVLKNDTYLHNYLSKVAYTTAAGLAGTALSAAAILTTVNIENYSMPLFAGSFVAMMGSAFVLDFSKPKFQKGISRELNSSETTDEIVLSNQPVRIGAMATLSLSSGVMLAPLLDIMHDIDPIIIPASACITTCVMAGMMHYAVSTPRSLIGYGPALHIGLWGLIGNAVVGLWLFPNQVSFFIDVFGGIGLFMGLTAYDTQCAIQAYKEKKPDHIKFAAQFYLDFLNLFIRIMEALAKAKK